MALQLVVDSLDGLDDAIKGLYVENNGKFSLDVDGIDKADSVQKAITREREARKEAERRLKELGSVSREDLDELESLRAEAAKAKGAEEFVNREKARHAKERETLEKQIASLRSNNEKRVLESTAMELAAANKGNFNLLKYHLLNELAVEEQDGDFRAVPRNYTSTDEIITNLKTSFPEAFSDSGHSGSGASGGHAGAGGAKTMTRAQFDALDSTAKHAHYSAGGKVTD